MTPERFRKLHAALHRRQPDLTLLADDVHKSHNISAVLRTCDAVGIHRIHAVSPGGEIRRHHMVSGGSKRWVDVVVHPSLETAVAQLKGDAWRLLAAHPMQGARDYREVDYTEQVAIVLGSELEGLTPEAIAQSDQVIAIPTEGLVASLNVSVAAALILFEARRQREAAGLYKASRMNSEEFNKTLFEWAYPEIAARCRQRNEPYPPLNEEGTLTSNPLAQGTTKADRD